MSKLIGRLFVVLCLCSVVMPVYADDGIKEGKWAVTVTSTSRGLPQSVPPQVLSTTACVTKNDLLPGVKTPPGCAPIQLQRTGSTITYSTTCDHPPVQMSTGGTLTYSGDNLVGLVKSHMVVNGNAIDIDINISGKYSGPCDQAQ